MARLSLFFLGLGLLTTQGLCNCAAAQPQQPSCHGGAQQHQQVPRCAPNAAYLVDSLTGNGACCPPVGHKYFWNGATQTGSCCPDTTVGFDGHMCVEPQVQPQYQPGSHQGCSGCAAGQAQNILNQQPGGVGPGGVGGQDGPPVQGNPPAPGYNYNNNNNVNNPTAGQSTGQGVPPGQGHPPAPGYNYNNNNNINNPAVWQSAGQGVPPAPGYNYNSNNNVNNPAAGQFPGPGHSTAQGNHGAPISNSNNGNVPGAGQPATDAAPDPPDNCVKCCGAATGGESNGACHPDTLSNGCTQRICPDVNGDKIGLEYGHCYRFKNPEGKALNKRDHGMLDYVWGGYYADIYQFRICRSTSDCSKGEELTTNSVFVINDQMGRTSKSSPDTLFWIVELPGWHFGNSDWQSLAVKFSARPWVGDTCGICLKGDGKGLGPVCPAGNPGVGFKLNPRYCVPIVLEEVPCLVGDGTLETGSRIEGTNQEATAHDEL